MKKIITYIFLMASALSFSYSGGNGTVANPYLISTPTDLVQLSTTTSDWDKHFKQTTDIILDITEDDQNNGYNISPIGTESTPFTGSYDGDGHTIANLYIVQPLIHYQGLFGNVNTSYSIKKLGLLDPIIWGAAYVGSLIGNNQSGTIEECYVTGGLVDGFSNETARGGLIGRNYGTITNCHSSITVAKGKNQGGFLGVNQAGGIVQNSYYYNLTPYTGYSEVVRGASNNTGAFIGANNGTIVKCYAVASAIHLAGAASSVLIPGTTNYVHIGGFVGNNSNSGTIAECYASTGTITVTNAFSSYGGLTTKGGFAGYNTSTISQSYWDTTTSGETLMAGVDSSVTSGATGKTTAQMQTQSTYTGWDFTTTWVINNTIFPNILYPVFNPSSLGIDEIDSDNNFTIYPNPTSSILNIKTRRTIGNISIYDLSGRKIKTNTSNENKVDVTNLPSGIYIIQLTFDNGNEDSLRFIKI